MSVGAEATGDGTWGGDGPPARPRAPKRHGAVRLLRAVLMLALLLVGLWALTVAAIHVYGQRDETRAVDAIVVLGAAQYDGRPSPVLKARLDHAVELYRRGVARTIIMTGGVGPGDTVSEAVVGRRYALHAHVPPGAVLTERSGMTTLESMQAVSAMMKARKMDTALLVSDPFHMLRLKLLAVRLHMHVYTSPTRTSPISANPDQERRFVLRESFGLPFALLERGK